MNEKITFTVTDQKEEITFKFSEAARGATGEPGASATVDQTIIDGSTNAVSGNAVFDGLALKAPIANPTFTGIVTAPRITGRCDGLEVLCKAGLAINAGQVVYVTGASGNNIIIGLAQANAELTSSKTIGISESTLATNATGYVITEGLMTVSISAPSAVQGDPIWLSPTTAGGMVFGAANKPTAPNHMVYLGVVTRKSGNTIIEIFVKVQNGSELEELADVSITSPTAGQALMRGVALWENRSLVATDISNSTSAGRALLTSADAASQRTAMGLGTLATQSGTFSGTSSGTNTGDQDLSGYALTTDLAEYLPLAGGVMDDNATIGWDNASAIREAGTQGLEIECSVGYRWQWVSGRMIMRQVNSGQIARIIAIDGINPSATDDETQGFVIGTRWETVNGEAYVCTDATTDTAIWVRDDLSLSDSNDLVSIDIENRQLIAPNGIPVAEWDDYYFRFGWDNTSDFYFSLDEYGINTPSGLAIDLGYSYLKSAGVTSVDWHNRQLIGNDGYAIFDWSGSLGGYLNALEHGILNLNSISAVGGSDCYLPTSGGTLLTETTGVPYTGATSTLDLGSYGLEALTVNTANGYTTQGSGAKFPYGIDMPMATEIIFPTSKIVNGVLRDYYSVDSINWESRQLLAVDGITPVVDWSTGYLDVNTNPIVGVYSIRNTTDQEFINGDAFGLYDSVGSTSVAWGLRQLIGTDGTTVIAQWGDTTFEAESIYSISGSRGVDFYNGQLIDGFTNVLDWGTCILYDQSGISSAEWAYRYLRDAAAVTSVDWSSRQLKTTDGTSVSLDWSTQTPVFAYGAQLTPTAIASLVGGEGTIAYANDADTPTIGSAVVSGGSAKCLVCYNGTDWIVTSLL